MTRAFVAVRPSRPVLDAVARATGDLELPGARSTTRAQWHLTLQFLGDVADVDAVAGALSGLSVPPAAARLGGVGAFPSARRATVLWIGLAEGNEIVGSLAREVAMRLAPLGMGTDDRPFLPHLTLARAKSATDLRAVVRQLDERDFGPVWTVGEVVLYESRLLRTGAEYAPRAVVTLRT